MRLVLVYDAMWGKFLEGEDEQELLLAFLIYLEEQLAAAKAQPGHAFAFIHIAVGGPPPISWGQNLSSVLEANYPERLHRAVVFPVPWFLRRVANGMLWFLPARTQEKFVFVSDAGELAEACSIDAQSIPEDIRDVTVEEATQKIASNAGNELWQSTAEGDRQTARTLYVAAGSSGAVQVDLDDAAQWVQWRCDVDPGYDIGLHVSFEQAGAAPVVLHEAAPFVDAQQGERFEPLGGGALVFLFDNTRSWIHGKNVVADVVVHFPEKDESFTSCS